MSISYSHGVSGSFKIMYEFERIVIYFLIYLPKTSSIYKIKKIKKTNIIIMVSKDLFSILSNEYVDFE